MRDGSPHNLREAIHAKLASGVSPDEVVADLRRAGWSEVDARAMIPAAQAFAIPQKSPEDQEALTQAVRDAFAKGSTREEIVTEFVAVGWQEGSARDFIEAAELGERDAASTLHLRAARRDLAFGLGSLMLGLLMVMVAVAAGAIKVGIIGVVLTLIGVWRLGLSIQSLLQR